MGLCSFNQDAGRIYGERERKKKAHEPVRQEDGGVGGGCQKRVIVVLQNTFYSPTVHIKYTRNSELNHLVITARSI